MHANLYWGISHVNESTHAINGESQFIYVETPRTIENMVYDSQVWDANNVHAASVEGVNEDSKSKNIEFAEFNVNSIHIMMGLLMKAIKAWKSIQMRA